MYQVSTLRSLDGWQQHRWVAAASALCICHIRSVIHTGTHVAAAFQHVQVAAGSLPMRCRRAGMPSKPP